MAISATMMVTLGVLAMVGAVFLHMTKNKRKDVKMIVVAAGIGLLAFGFMGGGGFNLGSLTEGLDIGDPDDDEAVGPDKPVESLKMFAKNSYTMADADEDVELYTKGADVSDPDVVTLSKSDISSGTATDTSFLWSSNDGPDTKDVYFEGGSTYYNELLTDWRIDYNVETGKGVLMIGESTFIPAKPFGTLSDLDTAAAVSSGSIVIDNGTDILAYDESAGAETFWIEFDLGNEVANSEIHDVVICLQDSNAGTDALEGNEISAIDVSYISGTNIDATGILSGEITSMFTDAAGSGGYVCKDLNANIGPNKEGRYRFTFTVSESNWVEALNGTAEKLKIWFDDLGGYSVYQYPDGNVKAAASGVEIMSIP